jgi:thiol-disulfide isomerase/thioredoxin/outer membrane lipoprotein-sorting protein
MIRRYPVSCAFSCLVVCLITICGCSDSTTDPISAGGANATSGEELTAETVLQRMAQAYKSAKSYQDAATVRLKFEQQGQKVDEKFDFSVAFERPNKLRLDCYGVVLCNDGKQVRGYIKDVEDLTGQVLALDAPEKLTMDNMVLDASMQETMRTGVAQAPPQLVLLLADNALEMILANAKTPLLLPNKNYEDDPCHRVRIDSDDGSLLLWIEEKTFALRRVDFPTTAFQKNLEQNGPVSGLELYAEFSGANLNASVPADAFKFEVPAEAKLVKRLLGPAPSPPSKLLGKPAPEFSFITVDGAKVTREEIKDKVVVLDFWFTQCTPCQQSFPLMNKVYQQFKNSDKVMFLAVNADDSTLTNQAVGQTMKEWGSELPLARDPNQDIRKAFDVTGMPTLFVIGPDGTVQHHEMGLNPTLEKDLPATIESLLTGKSTHELVQKKYDQRLAEFEQALQTPPEIPSSEGEIVEVPKATVGPRSEPARHRLARVWGNQEVKMPGNVLVLEPAGDATDRPTTMLVVEGWNTVVEMKADGSIVGRHELELPGDAVISTVRTAVDKDGNRYYAAFLTAQQQFHVFDQNWKRVLSFPSAGDTKHEGIGDVQFADLNADGTLELAVGYWGDVGVQYVAMDGKRTWTDRTLQYVLRLAELQDGEAGTRRLLCANSRGGLAAFSADGKAGEEITVAGRPLQTVYAADLDGDGKPEMCGLSFRSLGANSLVGFDAEGKELWDYELPTGVHEKPIEAITTARLLGQHSQWLIAGADGSVHILAADGKPIDRFNYGVVLSGLAGCQIDGEPALLISSENGIEAWKLEPTGETLATPGGKTVE